MQFLKLYLDLDYKCHTELDQKHINEVPHQCLLLVYVSRYSLPEEEVLWMSLLYIHVCTLCVIGLNFYGFDCAARTYLVVGDRVRVKYSVKTPSCGWGSVKHGEVGILKNLSGTSVTIDFPRNPGWGGTSVEVELCE